MPPSFSGSLLFFNYRITKADSLSLLLRIAARSISGKNPASSENYKTDPQRTNLSPSCCVSLSGILIERKDMHINAVSTIYASLVQYSQSHFARCNCYDVAFITALHFWTSPASALRRIPGNIWNGRHWPNFWHILDLSTQQQKCRDIILLYRRTTSGCLEAKPWRSRPWCDLISPTTISRRAISRFRRLFPSVWWLSINFRENKWSMSVALILLY